jgi:DMSO/TMAO reductase YedYZ molybdopterin-dependent catalytic subunit
MKYPWANVLILLLGGAELVTGYLALISGTPQWVAALQVHRILGFGIVVLLIWKGQNILLRLLNPRLWRRLLLPYMASVLLLALLLAALGLGLAWSHVGPFHFLGFSGVSWHIYLSLALTPFLLWHTLFHRWSVRPRFWAERRTVLRLGGLALAGLVLWRIGELGNQLAGLPGAERRFTGSYENGSDAGNAFPTTSWLNDNPSPVDASFWQLRVGGLVRRELLLSYSDLARSGAGVEGIQDAEQVRATLDCTGGWHSTQDWEGFPLRDILERAGMLPEAASVTVRSVTGYYHRFSLDEVDRCLLATRVGGESLSHRHGFPLRLVAPGKRGFEWVKWVEGIEVNDTSKWWQPPLPLT